VHCLASCLVNLTHFATGGSTGAQLAQFDSWFVSVQFALPTSIQIPTTAGGTTASAGEISLSDFTGDGSVGDLMPGTKVGAFGRSVSLSDFTSLINNYNTNIATRLTPAGQTMVSAGLFTQPELMALGAHPTALTPPPTDQANMRGMRAFDLTLAWDGKFRERFTISPSVGFYNLFNFSNFDLPGNSLSGSLTGSTGSINGTSDATRPDRVGVGTVVFALGSPRVIEFGLKLTF
jgi:hypothetical protein